MSTETGRHSTTIKEILHAMMNTMTDGEIARDTINDNGYLYSLLGFKVSNTDLIGIIRSLLE